MLYMHENQILDLAKPCEPPTASGIRILACFQDGLLP